MSDPTQHEANRVAPVLRRRLWGKRPAIFGIILVGALVLAACGSAGSGEKASDFTFNLYQGAEALGSSELRLSDLRGRPVVLNFWAGSCAPCRAEMPDLQEFYDEFAGEVALVGVDVGQWWFNDLGAKQDALDLLEDLQVTYPTGYATDQLKVSRDYRILSMPTTLFITADGDIFEKWTGPLNRDKLSQITLDMLSQSGA